jgi:predicted lipopolysaccharide heptosyltransferase III
LFKPTVNILLLQLKRIGDLVLTTPAINAVRQKFPKARITLVIAHECHQLASAVPNVDRFLIMRRNWRDVPVFLSIALRHWDFVVDFTRSDRSAALAYLSRARRRIAARRPRNEPEKRTRVYTDLTDPMSGLHTIDYHLALLRPLGIENPPTKVHLDLPDAARQKAQLLLNEAGIDSPFVVFHPGAARAEKFWEPERWAELIERTRPKIDIVLTGGRSKLEQQHIRRIKENRSVVDLSGQTDLLAFAAILAQARLLVTVDSAAMHLAAAMQTPQVVLFGPTNPFHWRPRESPVLILRGESSVPLTGFAPKQERVPMKQISTEAVLRAMDCFLLPKAFGALTS